MKQGNIKVSQIKYLDNSIQVTASLNSVLTINNVDGDYTLSASDMSNKLIRINSPLGTLSTVTLPNDFLVSSPVGTKVLVSSNGYGPITVSGDAGVNVHSPQSTTIERKYGRVVIIKTGTNDWEIDGQLVAQAKFEFLPINPRFFTYYLDRVYFDDLAPQSHIATYLSFTYGNQLFVSSEPVERNSSAYHGNICYSSTVFATTFPDGVYFRATSLTPGISLLSTGNYTAENVWVQYRIPTAANNYNEEDTNPRFMYTQVKQDEVPVTIKIELSETPDLTGFINSFNAIINPMVYSNFLPDFSYTCQNLHSAFFKISSYGRIEFFDMVNEKLEVTNFTTNPKIEFPISAGTYFRVTLNDIGYTNSGSGILGVLYTPDSINGLEWRGDNTLGLTYLVEILSDASGTLDILSSGTIKLKQLASAVPLVSPGSNFDHPLIVNVNSITNCTFNSQTPAIYFKIDPSVPGILHMYSTGGLDTLGTFYDSTLVSIDFNDDASSINFELFETVMAGTYYLKVESFNQNAGNTTVHIEFTPT